MAIQSEYGRCTIEICNSTAHLFSERREYPHLLLFEDDQIGGEYLLENKNIQDIKVNNGVCKADKNGYFINQLVPGTDCSIEITQKDGAKVRLVTLTEEESDQLWKGTIRGKELLHSPPHP